MRPSLNKPCDYEADAGGEDRGGSEPPENVEPQAIHTPAHDFPIVGH